MRHETQRHLRFIIIGVSALLIGLYVYNQTSAFARGPEVTIISPTPGTHVVEPLVTITGTTLNAGNITLNGAPIFVDAHGAFEDSLLLAPGYSILEVAVEDRFGRKTEKTLELLYTPQSDLLDVSLSGTTTQYGQEGTTTETVREITP